MPANANGSPQEPVKVPTPDEIDAASAEASAAARLSASHGFSVEAVDGKVGEVETPLFPPAGGEPDFLVVRLADGEASFAVVPVQLISSIDAVERRITVGASCSAVASMRGDIALEY